MPSDLISENLADYRFCCRSRRRLENSKVVAKHKNLLNQLWVFCRWCAKEIGVCGVHTNIAVNIVAQTLKITSYKQNKGQQTRQGA